jgi:hypothetical protein
MERSISFERTVPVDYDAAVAALREQPGKLVLDDEDASTLVLHAEVGGFDVARQVTVTIDDVEELDKHAVKLPVSWEASVKPKRFPTFDGGIEISAMSSHPVQSQVALVGTVTAPLGILGTVGEAAGGTDIGDAVLDALLDRIVARLQALVAERQAAAAADMTPAHMSRPRFEADD